MGNRGCLHDAERRLGVSRWRSKLWICCVLDWKGVRRHPMPPGRWTALFFLDEATALAVSGLRELSGLCPKDSRMRALIAELSDASPRFRELWGRAEVGYRLGFHHMRHPQVGELYLYRHRLNAPYPGGDHLLIYRAEPGSDSARALEVLRSLSAARGPKTSSEPALG